MHADRCPKALQARLSRRQLAGAGALFAATPILASAQQATPEALTDEISTGGVLRLAVQGDPVDLDPALNVLDAASLIVDLVYEGLVHEDTELQPQPALAEEWTVSDDGLTYTFQLRAGVQFHNGRELVADDVVWTFDRVMDPDTASPWAAYTAGIVSVEAPDETTVVFTLTQPDASFLANLGRRGLTITPREVVEEEGSLSQTMVGTGPFTFEEYVPNSSLTLGRNDAYWDPGKPYLDGIDILIVPENTQRTTALVSGTVDMIEQVPQADIPILEAETEIELVGGRTTNLRWLVFNLRREPFNDLEFRQAVATAIDRQPIIDAAVFGYGTSLYGVYPVDYWAGLPDEPPPPDPDAARSALENVDLPADFQPEIMTWAAYGFLSNTAVVVQEQLRELGIESTLDPLENALYLERYFSGDFDIAIMGAAGYIDPNDFLQQSLGTDESNNAAGYSNPDFDALLEEGLAETDREARTEIYHEVQRVIIDDAPWIALYTSSTFEGLNTRVQGFQHSLSGSLYALRETWIAP